nr:geraniol 8-hydroxylase-like [Ipomoea batatas]GMD82480.1 geraniol 8-hydroxylase-like [Ipomoea batatas]
MFQDLIRALHDSLQAATFSYALALLGVVWFAWVFIFNKSGNGQPPLPPGPRPLPLVGNLLSLDPELHTYFTALSKVHGPIYTLWLGKKPGIIISSPAMARKVLKDQDATFANRDVPVVGREATYGGKDIVWTPYGPEWRMLRKVCVREMLSNSTLDSVYDLRRREIRQTMKFFYDHAGRTVNIGEQMFLTILNVITGMMWGGTVKGKERESLGLEFREIVAEMIELLGLPNVSDFYPGLAKFDLQGLQGKMKRVANKLDKIFQSVIDQRSKVDEKKSKDFLQVLLQLKDEGDEKTPFNITHLKALLTDMVVAGTDTTSNAIEFAMAEIMNKPQVINKLQEEVDAVVGKDNIVEESHIHQLPYLDPSIWENPLEFRPERFLDSKWDFSGKDFNYFPFGSGKRICAGMASAERMFMYALASMIHSFDWKMAQGEKLELSEKFGIVLKKRIPLVAIPTPRLSHPALYQ